VTWYLDVVQPGTFAVQITYAAQEKWAGREFVLSLGDEQIVGCVEHTGDWYEYKPFDLGTVTLAMPGRYVLRMAPRTDEDADLMYFQSLQLVRTGQA
jgi:hypothetical protein